MKVFSLTRGIGIAVGSTVLLSFCEAFVIPPINTQQCARFSETGYGSVGPRGSHWEERMAVSPALAEEITNADDVPELKASVSVDAFEAMDIRVGRIVKAEAVPDPDHGNKPSRKYLSLVVDLGNEKRKVISGIRPIFDVEDAIGKAVLLAANLEEETVLGLPSRGRILSASNFSKEPMPRTLRTVLLGGGGVPAGSAITGL
ncbi:unnamed protein product [Choristocarpus tenellus]